MSRDMTQSPVAPFPDLGETPPTPPWCGTTTPIAGNTRTSPITPSGIQIPTSSLVSQQLGASALGVSSTLTTAERLDQGNQTNPDWAAWNEFQTFRARWHNQTQDTPDLAAFRREYHPQTSTQPPATMFPPVPHYPPWQPHQEIHSQNNTAPVLPYPWATPIPPSTMGRLQQPMSTPQTMSTPLPQSYLHPPHTSQGSGGLPYFYPPPNYPYPIYPPISQDQGTSYQFRRASTSPFVAEIEQYQLPQGTRLPTMKSYDGTTDPDDHIENYRWMMKAHYLDPRFWCTYFVTTLSGAARSWFKSLPPCTIKDFNHLEEEFLANFIQQRKFVYDQQALLGCRQRADETTQAYFARFNKATLQAPGRADSMIVAAFTYGLKDGPLFRKLVGKPSATRKELMERVSRYLRQEEAVVEKSRIEQGSKQVKSGNNPGREDTNNNKERRGNRREHRSGGRFQPFNRDRDRAPHGRTEAFAIREGRGARETKTSEKSNPGDKPKYCEFHSSSSHNTSECSVLRKEIDNRLQSGQLNDYVRELRKKKPKSPNTKVKEEPIKRDREVMAIRWENNKREGTLKRTTTYNITFTDSDPTPPNHRGDEPLLIKAVIANSLVRRIYIDNGSSSEVIFEHCFQLLPEIVKSKLQPPNNPLVGFDGHSLWPLGTITLPLTFEDHDQRISKTVEADFVVVRAPSPYNAILGRTSLRKLEAIPSTLHGIVKFATPEGIGTIVSFPLEIPHCNQIAEPTEPEERCKRPRDPTTREEEVIFSKHPDQPIRIGSQLPPNLNKELRRLLKNNRDIFAWSPSDMQGISRTLSEHKLNVSPTAHPTKQKRRVMTGDRSKAVNEEVEKLVKADILRESTFPAWIANPVLVRKSDGSWHMCIDYTYLNKACLKDYYPLPEIDQMVEALEGIKWKSFLDAYKWYHQIQMAKEDEDKTYFYTNRGTFCYKKMPFGLKNAGATYQRMVDRVFKDQIGRNVEVYVDDMVIKSQRDDTFISDIEETFSRLRQAGMKLNPSKCSFGVEEGKFLGYIVTKRGIQANPSKVEALANLKSPKTLKEIQALNGKMAALGRFIAKSAEKSLPFFKTLKGCMDKKNFHWTPEAETAFRELKNSLRTLPTLACPIPGETLTVYLSAAAEAISAVLVAERDRKQVPIFFVSRALQGPEMNYSLMEKITLSLVHAARRLRRYFQAHSIKVLTDQPIRQVLLKPERSGRMAKWAIELGEHDIEYCPRTCIKGQALADFLAEIPHVQEEHEEQVTLKSSKVRNKSTEEMHTGKVSPDEKQTWTLYTDGASSTEGAGAGLVLTNPMGETITYALRFEFQASNNEAEYEALIAGLKLAHHLGAEHLRAYGDSLLVTNQVKGSYEVRETHLQKYLAKVNDLIRHFITFEIEQVPRSKNKQADALSKMASTSFPHLTKEVLVEVLKTRSTSETEKEVQSISSQEATWMTPIHDYLVHGILPQDEKEARKVRIKAPSFTIKQGILYKRGYLMPWLRCVDPDEANYLLRETHEGIGGAHAGARSLAKKVMRLGYFWPTIYTDAEALASKCTECQQHAPIPHLPATPMVSISSPWPFHQWGIDIVGPFPEAPGRVKFLLVAVDYFTKWAEAEPLATITGKNVIKFFWKNIITRFGLPNTVVSDNGKQFAENPFKEWCTEMKIEQKFTSVAHPQANGQTEVTNRTLVQGIKTRLGRAKGRWVDELPSVLWSYRTTAKTATNETPFSLTYGSEAVLPPEIGVPTSRVLDFCPEETTEDLRANLDLLDERREIAALRQASYKSQTEKYYNARVRDRACKVGDLVMRKNEASRAEDQGKLSANWEGPYRVTEAHLNGSYKLETLEGKPIPRTWNIQNLKKYNF